MNKKAQALMFSLWILATLTVLVVGIGHRVSLALRLSQYQQDRLKAYCLAKAGIQRGIAQLEDDKNEYDSLGETWSTGIDPLINQPLFENVEIREGSGETFALRYPYDRNTSFCMADEEHKININTASAELLVNLLKDCNFEGPDAEELAKHIRIWRGDTGHGLQAQSAYYEAFKKKLFVAPEELILILEYFYKNKKEGDYQKKAQDGYGALKYLITVYPPQAGDTKVNINTAPRAVLVILAKTAANPAEQEFIDSLVTSIINFREGSTGPFKEEKTINEFDVKELTGSEEKNIFNNMKLFLTVKSNYFSIGSTGNAGKIAKKAVAIYNRQDKRPVYWHEN